MEDRDHPGMALETHLETTLRPELRVTPVLIQAMRLIAMPQVELEETIWQEAEENPFIEVREFPWDEEEQDSTPWWEKLADKGKTLHEHLNEQLYTMNIPQRAREAASQLIPYLNPKGFLERDPIEIAKELSTTLEDVEEGRRLLSTLDPIGCGARNVKESLLMQARLLYPQDKKVQELLTRGWELLLQGKKRRLATRLRITPQELEEVVERISHLTPFPGASFSQDTEGGIRADIVILYVGEELIVSLTQDRIPKLALSRRVKAIPGNPELRHYLRDKRAKALGTIRGLMLRERYLKKLGRYIGEKEWKFFLAKRSSPVALSTEEAARILGVSKSTVQRLLTGKYIHTPRGTFPLRVFFKGEAGEVKEIIYNLIKAEDPRSPMGDEKIAQELNKRGYKVARRTVTKYRMELGIPSSRERRGPHLRMG